MREDERGFSKCSATGKTRFPDTGTANSTLLHIKNMSKPKYKDGQKLKRRKKKVSQKRVYYCNYCKGFHLTSMKTFNSKEHRENNSRQIEYLKKFDIENWKRDSLPFEKFNPNKEDEHGKAA